MENTNDIDNNKVGLRNQPLRQATGIINTRPIVNNDIGRQLLSLSLSLTLRISDRFIIVTFFFVSILQSYNKLDFTFFNMDVKRKPFRFISTHAVRAFEELQCLRKYVPIYIVE